MLLGSRQGLNPGAFKSRYGSTEFNCNSPKAAPAAAAAPASTSECSSECNLFSKRFIRVRIPTLAAPCNAPTRAMSSAGLGYITGLRHLFYSRMFNLP
jgi:hypothetical protein